MKDRRVELMTRGTLQNLFKVLEQSEKEKAQALKSIGESARPGDWHDNFALEQAHRDSYLAGKILEMVQKMLQQDKIEIIKPVQDTEVVRIGNRVEIQYLDEPNTEIYTIGGPADRIYNTGFISYQSPIGQAALGRKAGEVVEVRINDQSTVAIKIVKILPSNFD
ncbi:MAG: GreA/GreB family elongation factor [Patescibacteria group bacterium]|nr:GreA/GreB family elongation factor [Patescibacteria group bacterium]